MRAWRLLLITVVGTLALTPGPAAAQVPAGSTTLVSRPAGDALPSGLSNGSEVGKAAVSSNGRYVAFDSDADGLLPSGMHSTWLQTYRLDRLTGQITLVSHGALGVPGNETSVAGGISDDGQTVAYYSQADNIVAGDANGHADIFVWRAATDTNVIASRATGAAGAQANGFNTGAGLSGNGNVVVWESEATNLAVADVLTTRSVYARDLTTNTTVLVSRADGAGGLSAAADSGGASPSQDGDVIAFMSRTDGLDPTAVDANGTSDVFVRKVSTGDTVLVSRREGGIDPPSPAGASASFPSISDNGGIVAFSSTDDGIRPGDANGTSDVFQRSAVLSGAGGTTALISRLDQVTPQSGNGGSTRPALAGNGGAVAFVTDASDLAATDTNGRSDFVARDSGGNHTLSHNPDGTAAGVDEAVGYTAVSLSDDATLAVFSGGFPSMVAVDDDNFGGVYGTPVAGGEVTHLSRPTGLAGVFTGELLPATSLSGSVSAHGRFVAFMSKAAGLSPEAGAFEEAYVRDVRNGTLELVSRASGAGPVANDRVTGARLSADGRVVVFSTEATNLDPADTSPLSSVYVRDRVTGVTTLVSRASGAGPSADDAAVAVGISADGSRVAFGTSATNLGDGSDPDGDIFVRDLRTGETILASRADGPAGASADQGAGSAALSGDGRVVAFSTTAANLGPSGPGADIFVRDLQAQTTVLGARADGPAGAPPDQAATSPALDHDGSVLAFTSMASNLGTPAGGQQQVFVRDLAAGTTRLVSRADGASGAVAASLSMQPVLSADGGRVGFGSYDGSLSGESVVGQAQYFVRMVATEDTQLVSRADGPTGAPQVRELQSVGPLALSADGTCAVWGSTAAGLAPVDYAVRDFQQAYLRAIDGPCATDADLPPATPPGGGTPGPQPKPDVIAPVLDRFTASRRTFAVGPKRTAAVARTRRTPRGTTLRYRLSEPATVRIAVARQLAGRRSGRRCVKPTRKLRKAKRCVRLGKARTLTRRSKAGTTKVAFSGRIGRKALATGRYTLTARATDAAGNRSKARTLTVRIARR